MHSGNIRQQLSKLVDHVEAGSKRATDPRLRGLLAKSAEVLKGLRTLFERYDQQGNQAKGKAQKPAPAPAKAKAARDPGPSRKAPSKGKVAAPSKSKDARQPGAGNQGQAAVKAAGPAKASGQSGAQSKAPRKPVESAKGDEANRKDAGNNGGETNDAAAQPVTLPAAMPKPQDPDELKAKADLQRKEARAPMMPMKSAPKPMPPQSGKPIWSLPHSS